MLSNNNERPTYKSYDTALAVIQNLCGEPIIPQVFVNHANEEVPPFHIVRFKYGKNHITVYERGAYGCEVSIHSATEFGHHNDQFTDEKLCVEVARLLKPYATTRRIRIKQWEIA